MRRIGNKLTTTFGLLILSAIFVCGWYFYGQTKHHLEKELGERLGISAAQIRKDLSQFGEFGKQGTGYNISFLSDQLRRILNIEQVWDIAVVGAGDIGHALAGYQGFTNRGFRVAIIFDNDPEKIGKPAGNFVIQDVNAEENYLSCSVDVKSEIVVPILKEGEFVAELDIDSHFQSPFTTEDRALLEAIADRLAPLF